MKYRNLLITLGVAAVAVPLLKALYDRAHVPGDAQAANGSSPEVKKIVERTLNEHAGEDSPFVHAFEEALEQKARHDKAPTYAAGLHA